jgi:hypothetical protein
MACCHSNGQIDGFRRRPQLLRELLVSALSQTLLPPELLEGGFNRMSHVVTVHTKVHDHAAVSAACQRLKLPAPSHGTAKLFSGEATGLLVQLPGWRYPTVIDTLTGTINYDN